MAGRIFSVFLSHSELTKFMSMKKWQISFLSILVTVGACTTKGPSGQEAQQPDRNTTTTSSTRIPVLFDTDANNELDDQHAMAYLFFNDEVFDIVGVTVNATPNGGGIAGQFAEAERVMKLCDVMDKYPLLAGAEANYEDILPNIGEADYDGKAAVDFIIEQARVEREQPLVLLPVGKLTNIALALTVAPDIKDNVKIVWLGANYPAPGEYNLVADIPSMNYILDLEVPFEMVTVRYGNPSGSDFVRVTPDDIRTKMAGLGPNVPPVEGRHGGEFTNFGDYSVSLFENIDLHGDPPARALYDMVAVAVLKTPAWGESQEIPGPTMVDEEWQGRPDNTRQITVWENFDRDGILTDFFEVMARSTE